jgi:hypothetical protein
MCRLDDLSIKEINELAAQVEKSGDPELMIEFNRDLVKMQGIRPGFYKRPVLPDIEEAYDDFDRVLGDFIENDLLPVGSLGR